MPARTRRSAVRTSLSYHRLRNARVARRIVAHTGLAPPCLVVEAGAGDGILTGALLPVASRIIAVERDRQLWDRLRRRSDDEPRVTPVLGDIRSFRLPREPYAFVANPPFSLTAELLRTVLFGERPPQRACLVLQRDAALHWAGAGPSSVVAVLAHALWEIDIALALRRTDFLPQPSVDCALLVAVRRPQPLVSPGDWPRFERFVRTGFGGRHTVRQNLRGVLRDRAFQRSALRLGIERNARPSELSPAQWLELFRQANGGSCPAP
jgi:23S rRNA (adenine-N6)-dimethyltransferase